MWRRAGSGLRAEVWEPLTEITIQSVFFIVSETTIPKSSALEKFPRNLWEKLVYIDAYTQLANIDHNALNNFTFGKKSI